MRSAPVLQGRGEHTRARGGAHQGEARQRHGDGLGVGAVADEHVELEVLHGRVEGLLHGRRQPVDLVDEQHVVVGHVGEQAGQHALVLHRRTGGLMHSHAHFVGHDVGQGGLAQSGGAVKEQVVKRRFELLGSLDHGAQGTIQILLTHIVFKGQWPQGRLHLALLADGRGRGDWSVRFGCWVFVFLTGHGKLLLQQAQGLADYVLEARAVSRFLLEQRHHLVHPCARPCVCPRRGCAPAGPDRRRPPPGAGPMDPCRCRCSWPAWARCPRPR